MLESGARAVDVGSRVGFAFVAALAGWAGAWCLTVLYCVLTLSIRHLPRYPAPPGVEQIVLIYVLCTLVFVFAVTLMFGAPYVAIRSIAGMLQRRWRFYVETGLAGLVAIWGFYIALLRPQAESLKETLVAALPLYGGFSLATSTMTSFVYLRWLRSRQRRQIGD